MRDANGLTPKQAAREYRKIALLGGAMGFTPPYVIMSKFKRLSGRRKVQKVQTIKSRAQVWMDLFNPKVISL